MCKKDRKWEFRTVRNGTVRIGGHVYRPEQHHRVYDGRLDGLRFLFGRYKRGDSFEPFVALWGTEAAARSIDESYEYGPECVDGAFPWYFWRREEPQSVDAVAGNPQVNSVCTVRA